jgi:hypothetical protein
MNSGLIAAGRRDQKTLFKTKVVILFNLYFNRVRAVQRIATWDFKEFDETGAFRIW